MPSEEPTVTVVIPVKPGLMPEAAACMKQCDYPPDRIDIFTAYGRNPSLQRNLVAQQATGEVLYFLDNDSHPDPGTLGRLVKHLTQEGVVIAGGPSLMPSDVPFPACLFGKTLESKLCTGGSASRYLKTGEVRFTDEREIILCNMVMKREAFLEFGGLNERLYPNEENELMDRVKHAGLKMVYDPDAFVTRMPRRSLPAFVRQIFNYGRGRGEQTIYYPGSFKPMNFMPFAFVVFLAAALVSGGALIYPFFLYFFVLFADAMIKVSRERKIWLGLLPATSFILHVTYGIGTLYGLATAPFKKPRRGDVTVEKFIQ